MPKRYTERQKKYVWRPKKKDPPPPPWAELPRDITANILYRLGAEEVLKSAIMVCTSWRSTCKDPAMWRVIGMSKSNTNFEELEDMCCYAVNLSQGELLDITIEDFGTDDLILHIAKRASKLRRLRIVSCYGVSNECLSKAVSQLLSLQDLQIYYSDLSIKLIRTVGRSCPFLKSFTYNNYPCPPTLSDNKAKAVAENMQGLHQLSLFGNTVTNKGVRAIHDDCPHLESLDLRRCFNVNLEGDLDRKCKQIKDLKRPTDPFHDYEFLNYVSHYDEDYYALDGYPLDYSDMYDYDDDDDDDFDFDDDYDDGFDSDLSVDW
ncbi:unnamed protein product [Cuscuta campestris]|uniref:F-box domain-containing protein n=1 Tax=Cuscuta campestris TaxID=132261 RepID=A0A484M033_9ASTE|nr:unnamed protein product [Cuscuta campestris]